MTSRSRVKKTGRLPESEMRLKEEKIKEQYGTPDATLAKQPEEQSKLEMIDRLTASIVAALEDKKGNDIEILNVAPKTTLADVFIIASGTSETHIKALAGSVEAKLEAMHGISPHHIEGLDNRSWVLLDYGDLVVHLMMPEDRMHYRLESLWRVNTERQTI
ncbi:MAG TPA: ribosome silencing factor [Clostridia bacterium]|nr:ribosome silencing factor [Clostridia bacterium]